MALDDAQRPLQLDNIMQATRARKKHSAHACLSWNKWCTLKLLNAYAIRERSSSPPDDDAKGAVPSRIGISMNTATKMMTLATTAPAD
jgi:hypothetical protein